MSSPRRPDNAANPARQNWGPLRWCGSCSAFRCDGSPDTVVRCLTNSPTYHTGHVPEGPLRIAQPFKAGSRRCGDQVPKGRPKSRMANSETLHQRHKMPRPAQGLPLTAAADASRVQQKSTEISFTLLRLKHLKTLSTFRSARTRRRHWLCSTEVVLAAHPPNEREPVAMSFN